MQITQKQFEQLIREELSQHCKTQLNESMETIEFIQFVGKFLYEFFGVEGLIFIGFIFGDITTWIKANFTGDETPEEIKEKIQSPEVAQQLKQAKAKAAGTDFEATLPALEEQIIRLLEAKPGKVIQQVGKTGGKIGAKEYAIHKLAPWLGSKVASPGAQTAIEMGSKAALPLAFYAATKFAADKITDPKNAPIYHPGYPDTPPLEKKPSEKTFKKDLEKTGTVAGAGPYSKEQARPVRPSTATLFKLAQAGDKKAQRSLTHRKTAPVKKVKPPTSREMSDIMGNLGLEEHQMQITRKRLSEIIQEELVANSAIAPSPSAEIREELQEALGKDANAEIQAADSQNLATPGPRAAATSTPTEVKLTEDDEEADLEEAAYYNRDDDTVEESQLIDMIREELASIFK